MASRHLYLVLLLLGWGIFGYLFVDYSLESPKRNQAVQIEIKQNTTLSDIGQILAEKNVLRHAWFFAPYVWMTGQTNLLAGVYDIQPKENLDQILQKISSGKQDLVKVTIPEGKTIMQIADILESKGFDKQAFLKEVNRKESHFSFEKEIEEDPKRSFKLEGYLFPSTYNFRKGATAEQIVNTMLQEFESKMKELDAESKLQESDMTVDEWVTFASLIEREGRVRSELPTIAGVIKNRLKEGMKLEVDAAVVYAWGLKGQEKNRLYFKDLEIDSPYNVYKHKGMPPGPISSPSEEALKAVLEPEEHNYLFYVTKKDGTYAHYFGETMEEHQANIEKSNQNKK